MLPNWGTGYQGVWSKGEYGIGILRADQLSILGTYGVWLLFNCSLWNKCLHKVVKNVLCMFDSTIAVSVRGVDRQQSRQLTTLFPEVLEEPFV